MIYYLMHLNKKVAKIDGKNQTVTIYDKDRMPLSLRNAAYKNLCDWLRDRSMNIHRPSAEKLTNIFHEPIGQLVLKMHGVSLNDCYWFRKSREKISWEDINFKANDHKNEMTKFILHNENPASFNSPDMTTNGRLEKTWLHENGTDFLLKEIEYDNPESGELLVYILEKAFPALKFVQYSEVSFEDKSYTVCENFLKDGEEFISAYEVYNLFPKPFYESGYKHLLQNCNFLKIPNVRSFLQSMLVFDHIIGNTDRHLGNFGFIRNAETLEFLGPAPLFDNEMAFGEEIDISKPFGSGQFEFLYKDTSCVDISLLKDSIIRLSSELKEKNFNDSVIKAFEQRIKTFDKVYENHIEEKYHYQYISDEMEVES